jgi:hypothetical protein
MAERKTIHIDFDRVLEKLRRGIRRSDVFMGIGLNAAEQNPQISHILAADSIHTIRLVKEQLTDDEKTHVAREFGKWVRGNGLRELLETFSIFMLELYTIVHFLLRYRNKLGALESYAPKQFERMGIGEQIEHLSSGISVQESDVRIVRSLNKARNCYAHRQGLVGQADVNNEAGTLALIWNAFNLEIVEPNGNVVSEIDIFDRTFRHGGTVQLRVIETKKDFQVGAELVLEKRELKEICLCLLSLGQRLFNEVVELARKEGILAEKVSDNLNDPKPI